MNENAISEPPQDINYIDSCLRITEAITVNDNESEIEQPPDVGSVLSFLSLLVTMLLPVIFLLFNNLEHSIRIDRQVVIDRVIKLPTLVFIGEMICSFLLLVITTPKNFIALSSLWTWICSGFLTFVILITTNAIRWLHSSDYSTIFTDSYREAARIKFMCDKKITKALTRWGDFWYDEQIYVFFDNQRLYPYLEAYLRFLWSLSEKELPYMELLFKILQYQIANIHKVKDYNISNNFFKLILTYFDKSVTQKPFQVPFWENIIENYFTELSGYHIMDGWINGFTDAIIKYPVIRNQETARALAKLLYKIAGNTWRLERIKKLKTESPVEYQTFYESIIQAREEKNINHIEKYLLNQSVRSQ